jgi:5-(carboxyamino)imidazole ribonucleotide synthase
MRKKKDIFSTGLSSADAADGHKPAAGFVLFGRAMPIFAANFTDCIMSFPVVFDSSFKLGLLGGGQLGRMLLQAAIDLDLHVKVLDPDSQAPCALLAPEFVCGSFRDYDTVMAFGQDCAVLTIEIEDVNLEALEALEAQGKRVFPQPRVLRVIQDKRTQKQFYQENDIPTSAFVLTDNRAAVAQQADFLPAFQKLGRGGYDGRGVQRLDTPADIEKAFDAPSLLEKTVFFEKEIAVIVARAADGSMQTFPTVEMVFHPVHHLVEYLLAPARIDLSLSEQAQQIARQVAQRLDIVGLLAVEMFVTPKGEILVNEVAPRPHNSGHHTLKANDVSQFEQHLRAVLGLPLGPTQSHSQAVMLNILGAEGHQGEAHYEGLSDVLAVAGVFPFLYGKKTTKPFRKMGHVTIVDNDYERLLAKVQQVQDTLSVVSK